MNVLDTLFQWLLGASLRASLLVLPILALQHLLRSWLPALWRYALWLPLALVLLLPVLPQRPWSFSFSSAKPPPMVLVPVAPGSPRDAATGAQPEFAQPKRPGRSAWNGRQTLAWIWLAGAAGSILVIGISYGRALRLYAKSGTGDTAPALGAIIAEEARRLRLRRIPEIVWVPAGHSPAVAGWWRPSLLLPTTFPEGFTSREAHLIIRHELMHVRRGDLPLNWLLCALHCLHWFNPLLWIAFARVRTDRELACDEAVLNLDKEDQRSAYGHALLKLQKALPLPAISLALVGIFNRGSAIKGRITRIAAFQSARPGRHVLAALLLAVVTLIGATRAQPPGGPSSPKPRTIRPQILVTAKFIETDAPLGSVGEVLSGAAYDRQLHKALNQKGAIVLSAPQITTKIGMAATVEIIGARETAAANAGAERFLGVRLELLPTMEDEIFGLTANAKIGRGEDAATEGAGTIDWGRVRMSEKRTSSHLEEGQCIVLDMGETRPGKHTTVFIKAEALDPFTGRPASVHAVYPAEAKRAAAVRQNQEVLLTAHLFEWAAGRDGKANELSGILSDTLGTPAPQSPPAFPDSATGPMPPSLAAVLTGPQFERLTKELLQRKSAGLHSLTPSGVKIQSGEETAIPLDTLNPQAILHVRPAISPEGHTVDIEIHCPSDLSQPKSPAITTAVTVWNGQGIVLQRERSAPVDGERHFVGVILTAAFEEPELVADPTVPVMAVKDKAQALIIPHAKFQSAMLADVIDYLRGKGREVDEQEKDPQRKGVNIVLEVSAPNEAAPITMDLSGVPLWECLTNVAKLSGLVVETRSSGIVLRSAAESNPPGTDQSGPAVAAAKRIIVPRVEFSGATVEEAVEFVRVKARALDPDKHGVNIVLKPGKQPAARLSLSLSDVPVWEVLRYIAGLANLRLEASGAVITLEPRGE